MKINRDKYLKISKDKYVVGTPVMPGSPAEKQAMEYLLNKTFEEHSQILHPDLVPYLDEHPELEIILRHPLVYQVPLWSNGSANKIYEHKKKEIKRVLLEKDYRTYVWLHERPHRLTAFEKISDELTDVNYWKLVSSIWTDTENSYADYKKWRSLFSSKRSSKHYLMDEKEDQLLRSLPDEVVIYRGCQKNLNENGLSWSLDKSTAEFFANRFNQKGIILEKKVSKKDIVAVFTGRGEAEVIFNDTSIK